MRFRPQSRSRLRSESCQILAKSRSELHWISVELRSKSHRNPIRHRVRSDCNRIPTRFNRNPVELQPLMARPLVATILQNSDRIESEFDRGPIPT